MPEWTYTAYTYLLPRITQLCLLKDFTVLWGNNKIKVIYANAKNKIE